MVPFWGIISYPLSADADSRIQPGFNHTHNPNTRPSVWLKGKCGTVIPTAHTIQSRITVTNKGGLDDDDDDDNDDDDQRVAGDRHFHRYNS